MNRGIERFETIINFVLDRQPLDTPENNKKAIMGAVDQLLQDEAMSLGEQAVTSLGVMLLAIYETGEYLGKASNPAIDRIAQILAEAGAQKNANPPA
jgi:hypothetical protein